MAFALPSESTDKLNLVAEILLWLGDDLAADAIYSITENASAPSSDAAEWAGVFAA